MTTNDSYWTLQTAIKHGGGFYRRLAEATLHADPDNKQRVLLAFPELQQCYGPQTHLHRQLRAA
jgi:hypothetical protein